MKDERIIDRVRQLLAMAGDTSSPHEAAIAASRARKLMDAHQISLNDLKDDGGFGFAAVGKEYRFMPKWIDLIAVGVAYLNDCKVIRQNKWKSTNNSYTRQLVFQGYDNDVQCATAIFDYLTDTVTRLCAKYMVELGHGTRYVASIGDPYKRGAAAELQSRMKAMAAERTKDVKLLERTTGTSLVVYKMAQVEAEFGEFKVSSVKAVKVRGSRTIDALLRGQRDGRDIQIHNQVE